MIVTACSTNSYYKHHNNSYLMSTYWYFQQIVLPFTKFIHTDKFWIDYERVIFHNVSIVVLIGLLDISMLYTHINRMCRINSVIYERRWSGALCAHVESNFSDICTQLVSYSWNGMHPEGVNSMFDSEMRQSLSDSHNYRILLLGVNVGVALVAIGNPMFVL